MKEVYENGVGSGTAPTRETTIAKRCSSTIHRGFVCVAGIGRHRPIKDHTVFAFHLRALRGSQSVQVQTFVEQNESRSLGGVRVLLPARSIAEHELICSTNKRRQPDNWTGAGEGDAPLLASSVTFNAAAKKSSSANAITLEKTRTIVANHARSSETVMVRLRRRPLLTSHLHGAMRKSGTPQKKRSVPLLSCPSWARTRNSPDPEGPR